MLFRFSIAFSSCKFRLLPRLECQGQLTMYRLLFMTYNGWVMLSVAVGAFIGYLAFGNSSATKTVACH